MVDTGTIVYWVTKGVIILVTLAAASLALRKKSYTALAIIVAGFVASIFTWAFVSLITAVGAMAWVNMPVNAQGTAKKEARKVKPGTIIGIILGIGFLAAPLVAYVRKEASLNDPVTQAWFIVFGLCGAFMIMNNLFTLFSPEASASSAAPKADVSQPAKEEAKPKEEPKPKEAKPKIRCRFCNKLYSAEYNGCPHCKKK